MGKLLQARILFLFHTSEKLSKNVQGYGILVRNEATI
jgi:hypothetical protein